MIKSKFILDIIEQSFNHKDFDFGDNLGEYVRPQIPFLTDINYNYTGVGLFVRFSYTKEALKYKSSIEDGPINGVDIKSPDLGAHALTTIFFEDGIIDYLEIWSVDGNYPRRELENYSFERLPKNIINNLPPKHGKLLWNIKKIIKDFLFKIKSLSQTK
jgi:hypothetical protein